jgi:integrase
MYSPYPLLFNRLNIKKLVLFPVSSLPPEPLQTSKRLSEDKAPFVPTEADIDQLISGSGRILSTFLQFLKETGTRSGEAACLKWIDIDFERKIARILQISRKLADMLNNHSRQSDKIFATLYSLKSNFYKTRKSIAFKLQNPRLKEVGLHTFRHWKTTTESTKQEIYYTSNNCSAIET